MVEEMWLHVVRYIDDEGVAQRVNPELTDQIGDYIMVPDPLVAGW